MLDGFTLSSKKLIQKKDFPPPKLPVSFRPVYKFPKKEDNSQSFLVHSSDDGIYYRQFLYVMSETTTAQQPSATVKKYTETSSRSITLGEADFVDPYSEVALGDNMDWDREHEKEEFIKVACLYQPLVGTVAARFTWGGTLEDSSKTETIIEQMIGLTDAQRAAEMEIYGKLTQDMLERHPGNLVCKRLNVPNPYPGSSIVGLGMVKRENYSVFNFLNFTNPTSAELQPLTDSPSEKDHGSSKKTDEKLLQAGNLLHKELSKGKAMKSIFRHLVNSENATQKSNGWVDCHFL